MSGAFRFFRWMLRVGLPSAALGLHFVILICYVRRWDHAAAITVLPFWSWGILGLILAGTSWLIFRTRWAMGVFLLWLVTIVVGSDETRPLLRVSAAQPAPGLPPDINGSRVLRIVTLNCKAQNPISATEVLPWQPDIIFFQEAPFPGTLLEIAKKLYPDGKPQEHFVGGYDCAILTRGKILTGVPTSSNSANPNPLRILPGLIELDGRLLHLVCVHLQGAETTLSLHSPHAWKMHYWNRQSRREEMIRVRSWMEGLKLISAAPVIIAGDFNAPAGDAVFRELEPDFTNVFESVGSGWEIRFLILPRC